MRGFPLSLLKRKRIIAAGLLTAAMLVIWSMPGCSEDDPPSQSNADQPIVTVPASHLPSYQGADSCANAGCHGDFQGASTKIGQNEFRLFHQNKDPHLSAHLKLGEPLSQDIIRRLAGAKREDPDTIRGLYEWCFRCHNTTIENAPTTIATVLEMTKYEGVGCEACHGASSEWITSHWQDPLTARSFRQLKDLLTEEFSKNPHMVPLKDLNARAALCTRCHVGQSLGDVNHDLIAAGHPVMRFELSYYHHKWPKHWERIDHPDHGNNTLSWELWRAGQQASALRALALCASRAMRDSSQASQPMPAWPEFAEYACSACHQSLSGTISESAPARPRASQSRRTPPWNSWPLAFVGQVSPEPFATSLAKLRHEMQSRVRPDADKVANFAVKAFDQLRATNPNFGQVMLSEFADADTLTTLDDWETIAQLYFAAHAAELSFGKDHPKHAEWTAELQSLSDALRIGEVYAHPRKLLAEPRIPASAWQPLQNRIADLLRQLVPPPEQDP